MSNEQKKAVVLLSGGLDSTTTLAMAIAQGYSIVALSFDYGQRHAREIAAAAAVVEHYWAKGGGQDARVTGGTVGVVRHETMTIDLRAFGGSALTADIDVPKDSLKDPKRENRNPKPGEQADSRGGIPITYVPARNTVFLSFALGLAEVTGAFDIFLGVNAVDYSGYPDCRPEFIEAFERLANLATRAGVEGSARNQAGGQDARVTSGGVFKVHAPLIQMTKGEIIGMGLKLGVPYELTHSCYDPTAEGKSCGHCDSCLLRLAGFRAAGVKDPVAYM